MLHNFSILSRSVVLCKFIDQIGSVDSCCFDGCRFVRIFASSRDCDSCAFCWCDRTWCAVQNWRNWLCQGFPDSLDPRSDWLDKKSTRGNEAQPHQPQSTTLTPDMSFAICLSRTTLLIPFIEPWHRSLPVALNSPCHYSPHHPKALYNGCQSVLRKGPWRRGRGEIQQWGRSDKPNTDNFYSDSC